jgi:hypothetical protein
MLIVITTIQHNIRNPCQSSLERYVNKRYPNRSKELTLLLFAGSMILYVKNPENSTKNFL